MAAFAERYGAGLLAKAATLPDAAERSKVHALAMQALRRAQAFGDNSPYVRTVLGADSKTFAGAAVSGFPLSDGYTHQGKPDAQIAFRNAEAAFGRSDWTAAAACTQAAALDPAWYAPALFAGDSYFRLKDRTNAVLWFTKATSIDPDRETAYRYWGDTLFQAGDWIDARQQFVQAVVAEPYSTPPLPELGQWAQRTGNQLVTPAITRPEFITPDGTLQSAPELAASTNDGRPHKRRSAGIR